MRVTGSPDEWELHQWANDWITGDNLTTGASNVVLSPLNVKLEPPELLKLIEDYAKPPPRNSGQFWTEWNLNIRTGYFTRRLSKEPR